MKRLHLAFLCTLTIVLSSFAKTDPATIIDVDFGKRLTKIDSLHYGIFYEDINHAGDGGVYAELIRNRSFEESPTSPVNWQLFTHNANGYLDMSKQRLLNDAQQAALKVELRAVGNRGSAVLVNEGYWGINAVKGQVYTYSFFARQSGYNGSVEVSLVSADRKKKYGSTLAAKTVSGEWTKYTGEILCEESDPEARFAMTFDTKGDVYLDMVCLFPPTYKDRPNGFRKDLIERMKTMNPGFMRFPGGCFVEGELIDGQVHQFHWEETIGPIEQRRGHYNVWRYPVSDGLGFHEYLQLAEDLGAAPLYVTSVGIWHGGFASHDSIDYYLQDVLDAIEYANGDSTTVYGAMRIANGHPEPFNLRLIELGNENYQKNTLDNSDHYPERYIQFYNAIKSRYPYITIVGNVEALGTDTPSWRNEHPVEIVDEHYFRSPRWFVDHYTHYDNYDRKCPRVYAGEYAVTRECGINGNLNSAIAEAVFLMGTENNSDVVAMTSYAPMFKNENEARWNPDLIHFNSSDNFVTPSYHTQVMMANNVGDHMVKTTLKNNDYPDRTTRRYSVEKKFVYGQECAELPGGVEDKSEKMTIGDMQNTVASGSDGSDVKLYFEQTDSLHYGVWHLGADGNHRLNVELHNGNPEDVKTLTYRWRPLEKGKEYLARLDIAEDSVFCYLNGELQCKARIHPSQLLYTSSSVSDNGETGYIKIANPSQFPASTILNIKPQKGSDVKSASLFQMTSESGLDENSMEEKDKVKPVDKGNLEVRNGKINIIIPPFSLNVIKVEM